MVKCLGDKIIIGNETGVDWHRWHQSLLMNLTYKAIIVV